MELQGPFTDSTALLDDGDALHRRFDDEGYLYLRGVVPTALLSALRQQIAQLCVDAGWLKAGSDPQAFEAWTEPAVEGEERYFEVYDRVQRLEAFHALPHSTAIMQVMQALLGPTAWVHPLSIARLVFPYNEVFATPPHQDYANNQGTADLYACWMPLSDCPLERGPLAIAPGSHHEGVLPLEYALGAGHRQIAPALADRFTYRGNAMTQGDMLVFHSHTVHRSLPNTTKHMRISVDYRFQREGEALVAQSLQPHFERQSWDTIYADWQDESLKYYWRDRDFVEVEWDPDLHSVPQSLQEAAATSMRYKQQRAKAARRFEEP